MLNVMIVEDILKDAEYLKQIIEEIIDDAVFLICETGEKAMEYIYAQKMQIDIFFLDRELPEMSGFDLAARIRDIKCYIQTPIVFVTGHESDQLNALQEYHCYSYIVKPFNRGTVNKRIGTLLQNIIESKTHKPLKKGILIDTVDGSKIIYADNIIGTEVAGHCCKIYTITGNYEIVRMSLLKIIELVDSKYFIRCHKSFSLNLNLVEKIRKLRRNIWIPEFEVETDFRCEISRTYYNEVMRKFKENHMKRNAIND